MLARSTLFAAFVLTACASGPTDGGEPARTSARSQPGDALDLRDAQGQVRARATVKQSGDSLRVRVEAIGMTPGSYGAHIHSVGRCDAPAFTTAGPHWNPNAQMHGKDNPRGMHKGDLPNLVVSTDGRGSFEYTIPNAGLSGMGPNRLFDADGAAVVIHAAPDDYRTDPSGNSGARIACGVLS